MLNVVIKFFTPKAPTSEIAGVALAHDEAVRLIHTCSALKNALNLQLDAIGKLPSTPNEHVCSKIRQTQNRHTDIHTHLALIVSGSKCSTILWVHGFGDARAALEGKIVAINRCSRGLGWIDVARQYWPGVAVTYGWLLPLVIRLQGELRRALKQKDLWTVDTALQAVEGVPERQQQELAAFQTDCPYVHFGRETRIQEHKVEGTIGEQSTGETYAAGLSDGRKRTAGKFKGKKTWFT